MQLKNDCNMASMKYFPTTSSSEMIHFEEVRDELAFFDAWSKLLKGGQTENGTDEVSGPGLGECKTRRGEAHADDKLEDVSNQKRPLDGGSRANIASRVHVTCPQDKSQNHEGDASKEDARVEKSTRNRLQNESWERECELPPHPTEVRHVQSPQLTGTLSMDYSADLNICNHNNCVVCMKPQPFCRCQESGFKLVAIYAPRPKPSCQCEACLLAPPPCRCPECCPRIPSPPCPGCSVCPICIAKGRR